MINRKDRFGLGLGLGVCLGHNIGHKLFDLPKTDGVGHIHLNLQFLKIKQLNFFLEFVDEIAKLLHHVVKLHFG